MDAKQIISRTADEIMYLTNDHGPHVTMIIEQRVNGRVFRGLGCTEEQCRKSVAQMIKMDMPIMGTTYPAQI